MLIFYIIDSLRAGGKERQLLELIQGVSGRKDLAYKLVVMSHDADYPLRTPSSDVFYVVRRFRKDPSIFWQFLRLFKLHKPDIIHSWSTMTSVYCAPIAKLLGITFINGMIRDVQTKFRPFNEFYLRAKLTFPLSDAVVSNTFAGLGACRLTGRRAHCIHNGFDFSRIASVDDQARIRSRHNIEPDKIIVGMAATFSRYRDWETYIRAAKKILRHTDNRVFFCIGGGPAMESCRKLADTHCGDRIIFTGHQSRVESYIHACDIGVLLTDTRFLNEGLSNSLMEFMALGKPVIATDCGGNRELIAAGRSGFLVQPFDHHGLALKIQLLANDPNLRLDMGKAGREIIEKQFSLEKMTNSYLHLYNSLLPGLRGGPAAPRKHDPA